MWKATALCLCALACTRDLAVPPLSEKPVVTSFSPTQAFAQATLTIKGKNFDPVAANNVVQFYASSTHADSFSPDGDLLVTVPDSNDFASLNGTIAVNNGVGVSDPSPMAFEYLGRGHPFIGTTAGSGYLAHHTPGLAVFAGGELFIGSRVSWALLGSKQSFLWLAGEPDAVTGLPDRSAIYAATGSHVMGWLASNSPTVDLPSLRVQRLSASPASTRLAALAVDPLGVSHLVGLNPSTLAILGNREISGPALGLAALDDGRAALIQAAQVLLIDPASGAQSAVAAPSALSGAAVATSAGLAVACADGTVRLLDTGASSWGAAISTGSPEPFAELAASGPWFAGSKPTEGVVRVLRTDGQPGSERSFAGQPRALIFDGGQILVADDSGNAVEAMDPATGAAGPRVGFHLGIGSSLGCSQGSAVEEDLRLNHYRLLTVATRTNQLLTLDYNSLVPLKPILPAPGSSALRAVAMPYWIGVYTLHDVEIGHLKDDDTEEILTSQLPGTQCLLFADRAASAMVALGKNTAAVLRGREVSAPITLPGPIVSGGVRGDGKVVIFYGDAAHPAASPRARVYSIATLAAGGAPEAEFGGASRYQGFLNAFVGAWGPLLFFSYDTQTQQGGSFAVPLDAQLVAQPAVNAGISEDGPVRLTPDGYFIAWRRKQSRDNVLRISSAYELNTIYSYAAYRLGGEEAMPVFDSSGQYMYVPIPEHDTVETYQ